MSCNKFRPHLLVIPEDDANRQLANGFVLGVLHDRQVQILQEVGGWRNVCEAFVSEHVKGMRVYENRHLLLLLDFDNDVGRPAEVLSRVPIDLKSRVFLLGVQSEPESLKVAGLGSFEHIGRTLATECQNGQRLVWAHELLQQNTTEISRLEQAVRGFLF